MQRAFAAAVAVLALGLMSATAAATSGTAVSLTTSLTFDEGAICNHTANSPCPASGTFTAANATTASLICSSGTLYETHWFTHGRRGPITIADRTWTCPDGSTLVMHVLRWTFTPLTDSTAEIGETWVITSGTGRFTGLRGTGTMTEVFDFGVTPATLGGSVTGVVR